tara:strand:- start:163 stop:600 length:438 start_codon:yes stop_codon:yes gene_type:complete
MEQTINSKFRGKTNNLSSPSITEGKRIGKKANNEYVNLFDVNDLIGAKIQPATTKAGYSPMSEPNEANFQLLIDSVSEPNEVILNKITNTDNEKLEQVSVPDEFIDWEIGRLFWYEVDENERSKISIEEVTEETFTQWKQGTLVD